MGRTVFLAKANTIQEMCLAVTDMAAHNEAPMEKLGGLYSDDEFAALDPRRHQTYLEVKEQLRSQGRSDVADSMVIGCMEKWTRGEDVRLEFLVFEKAGDWWIEATNGGGGACTTRWLEEHGKAMWHGTRGKPFSIDDADPIIVPHTPIPEFFRKWSAAKAAREE